jgi:hypothetical protein
MRAMSRPSPMTVTSTRVSTPRRFSAFSLATASAMRAFSFHPAGIVQLDFRAEHEDVLVHEGRAKLGRIQRTADGFDVHG